MSRHSAADNRKKDCMVRLREISALSAKQWGAVRIVPGFLAGRCRSATGSRPGAFSRGSGQLIGFAIDDGYCGKPPVNAL
jgi:hypothetical protein